MGAELPELRQKGEALDRFSDRLLTQPGIPGLLRELEESHGADRAVVLIFAWLASGPYRPVRGQAIEHLAHVSSAWQTDLIQPLERLKHTLADLKMREAREVLRSLSVSESQAEKASRFALLRRVLPLVPAPEAEPARHFKTMMRSYQNFINGPAFTEDSLASLSAAIVKSADHSSS